MAASLPVRLKSLEGVLAVGSFVDPFFVMVKETGLKLGQRIHQFDFQLKHWKDDLTSIKTIVLDSSWPREDLKKLKTYAPNSRFLRTSIEHSYLLGLQLQHGINSDTLGVLWDRRVSQGANVFMVSKDALHIPIGWSSSHLKSLHSWVDELSFDGLSKAEIKDATSYSYAFVGDVMDIDSTYKQWCRDNDAQKEARAIKTLILMLGDLLVRAQNYTGIRKVVLGGDVFDNAFFREIVLDFLDLLDLDVYTTTTPLKNALIISQGQALQGCLHQTKKKRHVQV